MKCFGFILFCMSILLAWCSQHKSTNIYTGHYIWQITTWLIDYTKPLIHTTQWSNFYNPSESNSNILSITGTIKFKEKIFQNIPHISVDNNLLTYSDFFTIEFPKNLSIREYYNNKNIEIISFYNKYNNNFSISKNPLLDTIAWEDEKIKCTNEVVWSIISTTSKQINNRNIYMNTIMYPDNTLPQEELCFIDNWLIYKIILGNYSTSYIKNIFNSLNFMEEKKNIESSNTGEKITLSSLINPISTLYSPIILSGHILIYSWIFSINLPTYFQFRKSFYPWKSGIDVYFSDQTFLWFDMDSLRYIHLVVNPLPPITDIDTYKKCLMIQWNITPLKLETITWNITLYKNYRSYDSFGYRWKQSDLCFVDNSFIYNISIRQYTTAEVITIINSFKFLN